MSRHIKTSDVIETLINGFQKLNNQGHDNRATYKGALEALVRMAKLEQNREMFEDFEKCMPAAKTK